MTPKDAALNWIGRGYLPLPIPFRAKRPVLDGWPALRIGRADVPTYFAGEQQNIGVLLGEPYGAADIDLDCNEAIAAAAVLAPATGLVFGRLSKPASHLFYRSDPPMPSRKYVDPTDPTDGRCLCELRCLKKDGTVGLQTVVPPSTHKDTGELIRFETGFNGEPANIDGDVVQRVVARIAAAALLARHWPAAGHGRHDCELALAGCLARAGWPLDDAEQFVLATYGAVPSHDRAALGRVRTAVRDTLEKHNRGDETTGFTTLAAAVGEVVSKCALKWLDITANEGRAAAQPGGAGWQHHLMRGQPTKYAEGSILAVLANAITALRQAPEWDGVLGFNDFSLGTVALKPAPWAGAVAGAEWTDHEDRLTANWLQHQGILVSPETAGQAVQCVARDKCFHPVKEYLDSLTWDGTKRIDSWLSSYLGAESNDYAASVGARWLISAVARIYQPGAKVDCCLILEGPQGSKKSTALKTIAGDWFTDEIAELGSKDAAMQTQGVWIIEIAELDSMSRGDVGKIKAFISRATNRFRPPYGKRTLPSPRQCVFAGSVNHSTYLRDETGGRRFWPVACTGIVIDSLARDRDQLWAESVSRYRSGSVWWLDSMQLNRLAEREQSDRYEGDPWDEIIANWVDQPSQRRDVTGNPLTPFSSDAQWVSISDVLTHCLDKRLDQWTQADKNRVGRCLRAAGWEPYRESSGKKRRGFRRITQ